ncbi:BspA family leucine-rich repeat surface protein [Pediococcus acidilactici]|uniref:BspA family leucine-rich repeat surface protein n=1 Tax=Pediococcus acidilactici TaxID=1254 RepID=UPI001C703400|nr:BspA family leucine-rich repeat surface protein [Pediococcus acidilactici]MBW9301134.1 BspA family leucine-rich repeat surface protein [Pediococcus acidilactici]
MNSEIKKHYKMYKAGKRWVFCGLATLGIVVGLNTVNQHAFADTVTQTSPTTEQTNAKTPKSADADKPTPQAKDNTTEKQTTKAQPSSVAVNVTIRSASQTENNKQKDVNDISKADTKKDTKTDVNANSNSQAQSSAENKPATTNTEESENAKNNSDEKDSVVDQASPETKRNDKSTNQVSSDQDVSKKEDSKAKLTSTKDQQNKVDQKKITKSDVKKDAKSSSDNIAEGTFGTSDWYIDQNKTLYIGGGEFGANTTNESPWVEWVDDIEEINFKDKVKANAQSAGLFGWLVNVKSINGLNLLDTSDVINMSSMFYVNKLITSLDVSTWDTSNVTDLGSVFDEDKNLTNIHGIEDWDTSNVTDMGNLFTVTSLIKLDLSRWDVHNVKDMENLFWGDSNLVSINVSNWTTSNVIDMKGVFSNTPELTNIIGIENWDTSNVTTMKQMFYGVTSLQSINLSRWNTHNVTDMSAMFFVMAKLKTLNLSNWDTSNVTDMGSMFEGTWALERLDLSSFDMTNTSNYKNMFDVMRSLRVLILGKNVKIDGTALGNPMEDNNKRWIAVAGGTEDTPLGDRNYTGEELMTVYNGDMADTYVIDPYETVTDSKDVTQTIYYVNQNGDSVFPDHTQVRHYSREGKNNSNTGETTWGTWTIADGENAYFDAVKSPDIQGYAPDMPMISKQPIDEAMIEMGGQEITVTYNPIELKGSVTYWDDDENKLVSTDNLNGHFDEDGYFTITVPSGYEINPENNPNSYTDGQTVHFTWSTTEGANDFTINLRHKHEAVDPSDPEASRTVTQTIHYVDQNGNPIAPDHTASRHYTRTGDKDLVTGQITWSAWTIADGENGAFDAVESPDIPGYTPDMPMISKQPIDDAMIEMGGQDITVTYSPVDLKGSVTYWNDEENKVVSTSKLDKSANKDADFKIAVPSNYEIDPKNNPKGYVDGQTVHFTWSAKKGANDFTINLKPKLS